MIDVARAGGCHRAGTQPVLPASATVAPRAQPRASVLALHFWLRAHLLSWGSRERTPFAGVSQTLAESCSPGHSKLESRLAGP